ncbi:MAG: hypothetical protein MJ160_01210 [Treponema sp.]|nr:hypothetical protein [Treponema sp.]
MKKTGIFMKRIIRLLSLISLGAILTSCEIGLGEVVDMQAPVVNVVSPERTGYILKTFQISGTATDNTGISTLSLTVEPMDNPTDSNSYFFRIANDKWQKLDVSSNQWNDYENEYNKIAGNKKNYSWTLSFELPETVQSGTDFIITTQVYDSYNNESKNSKDERSVTVDMEEPVVSLIAPSVRPSYSAEFDAGRDYKLEDNSVLANLLNGTFTISGSQKEDAKLSYLIVYLDEKQDKNLSDLQNAVISQKVTGDNLRNWSTDINLSKIPGYETGKHILRIVTESHDSAGNIETKVHGWFTYWNDADKPWVSAGFGEGSTENSRASVYPSCALQGQAYDDDGLKSLSIMIYKNDETTPISSENIDLADENYPTYKAWTINALGESCDFRVEVSCTDINNIVSTKIIRYLTVTDTNPPKIVINTDTSVPMLGDASGKVTLSGTVTDDGGIKSVYLVRVKSGISSDALIDYYNSKYSQWNKASSTGTIDSNGNKIWNLTLSDDVIEDTIHKRTFTKDFNIFTDFGINGSTETLTTQNFIIMAKDTGDCANIDSFTWAGDTIAPNLTIDTVTVNTSTGTKKESIDFAEYNTLHKSKKLQPFNKNSSGVITDKVILSGTWSDNSTDNWTNKSKRGNITINWEGASVTVNPDDNGTWSTNPITPPDVTTASISAQFQDYAKNTVKVNENFFVSSSNPELLRISAIENDGSYKVGDKIHITLEFNKAVTFSGGTAVPSLTLNVPVSGTKKTINYDPSYKVKNENNQDIETNGTATHVFTYTVSAGEDIPVLDVTNINLNGHTWKDSDGLAVKSMAMPSTNNKLNKSRTITIDTISPYFKAIKAITPAGSYNKGKEIFIQAQFSEEVTIETVSKIKLGLNAASQLETDSAVKTGPDTVLFTYSINDRQNVNGLDVNSITITDANIKDAAGNILTSTRIPERTGLSSINVDTTTPGAPTITGITNNAIIYASTGAKFTIAGFTDDVAVRKYSVDNGKSWSDYTGQVTLLDNGDYTVTAYQQDKAGNVSSNATAIHFNIDAGHILTSVTAGVPTGTYTTGKEIPIYLNFRKPINVNNAAALSLNLSNGQKATYSSGSGTTQALFKYTVQEGDSCDALNVTSITGTFTDAAGNNVSSYVTSIPTGKNLVDSRTIKIVTGQPIAGTTTLTGNTLSVDFGLPISKGTGNITITHGDGYKAPAVLSVEKYNKLKAKNSAISTYYEPGTNGSDANGNSDLTEKYILKYTYDVTNTTVIAALKTAGADQVIVPINSSYVTVSGTKLLITLEDSYELPVKGATYSVSLPASLVKDRQNHTNDAATKTITLAGVEAPAIRINKVAETINVTAKTVTQPTTAGVKIDCQTPGIQRNAGLTWTVKSQTNDRVTKAKGATITQNKLSLSAVNSLSSTNTATPFNLGSTTDLDKGYIYQITAVATKSGVSQTTYEFAYRTVYSVQNTDKAMGEVGDSYTQFWLRGGDDSSGGVSTAGFPVSWNTSEFDKVRAMTKKTNSTTWYWITWNINTKCYPQPLRGDFPSDAVEKGPSVWCWGMQGPIPEGLDKFILYPGHSMSIDANVDYQAGNMSFYEKHCEYRDNNGNVVKSKKP